MTSLSSGEFKRPDRDMEKAHPLLRRRWPQLQAELNKSHLPTKVMEVFRSNERQAWLYGQGRSRSALLKVGVNPDYARPGDIITHAYSSSLSAHGWRLDDGSPASCAMDVVPLGPDGTPWSKDDPWDEFVDVVARVSATVGLRHFAKPGKRPWDKPHVQLVEWSDSSHRLVLPV